MTRVQPEYAAMRRLPTYTADQMRDAVKRAKTSTGWPVGMALQDMAAHILAGHDADDVAIEEAAAQIGVWMARTDLEGQA